MPRPRLLAYAAIAFLACPSAHAGDFDWLTGHWRSEQGSKVSEEMWTNGEGGVYFAVNRSLKDGKTGNFEFIRITTGPDAAYIAQPGGGTPVAFPLVEHSASSAVFLKPDHDYPQKISYVRDGNRLTATISKADGADATSWAWTLVEE
ncbi:DUF6265 family protein [Gimibacter soli]|uniref:DUF6265 family protein n=1 Tax=Gimibacter soli TaxID=3024400 RepID=A0AAE9XPT8_9PROT|nr:DUF6265 family protein [Gimibacter soli]WCL52720.1 DUF6265 family protein [Gimibacter soli]